MHKEDAKVEWEKYNCDIDVDCTCHDCKNNNTCSEAFKLTNAYGLCITKKKEKHD